ncbi:hypothetical protein TorRG33x02_120460 [Trema orientale]|uniref:Uncharacterized protein n=1 Tax=Trema orientale TaxID=63057 RepID=A0A2P5F346_TREOI|nr:hypothetical protein TorRG33x02_120460 [Trema orientale]
MDQDCKRDCDDVARDEMSRPVHNLNAPACTQMQEQALRFGSPRPRESWATGHISQDDYDYHSTINNDINYNNVVIDEEDDDDEDNSSPTLTEHLKGMHIHGPQDSSSDDRDNQSTIKRGTNYNNVVIEDDDEDEDNSCPTLTELLKGRYHGQQDIFPDHDDENRDQRDNNNTNINVPAVPDYQWGVRNNSIWTPQGDEQVAPITSTTADDIPCRKISESGPPIQRLDYARMLNDYALDCGVYRSTSTDQSPSRRP